MSSYLWIGGAIQPDTTERPGRRKYLVVAFVAVLIVLALASILVRAKAALGGTANHSTVTRNAVR